MQHLCVYSKDASQRSALPGSSIHASKPSSSAVNKSLAPPELAATAVTTASSSPVGDSWVGKKRRVGGGEVKKELKRCAVKKADAWTEF
jgi:hypothetical protein